MMIDVAAVKDWYLSYAQTFYSSDMLLNESVDFKTKHTLRVYAEITDLGSSLNFNNTQMQVAQTVALLHDAGRFEQYRKYKSYADIHSHDHAQNGVEIIREKGILDGIDTHLKEGILCAVANHNKVKLPVGLPEESLVFAKLIRDADKLDIWHIATGYYENRTGEKNRAIDLGLPDTPDISDDVCSDLLEGRVVMTTGLRTLNDMKILQMGWVYDINFCRTFQRIRERNYLARIYHALPHNENTGKIFRMVDEYVHIQCSS